MSMTTRQNVRHVAPYQNPYLSGIDDRDPRPSQARPVSSMTPRRATLRHYLEIDGEREPLSVRVEHYPDRPSWGPLPFRVVILSRGYEVVARVCNAPEGIVCTCRDFHLNTPCAHARAVIAADLFPEVSCDLPPLYRRANGGGGDV